MSDGCVGAALEPVVIEQILVRLAQRSEHESCVLSLVPGDIRIPERPDETVDNLHAMVLGFEWRRAAAQGSPWNRTPECRLEMIVGLSVGTVEIGGHAVAAEEVRNSFVARAIFIPPSDD